MKKEIKITDLIIKSFEVAAKNNVNQCRIDDVFAEILSKHKCPSLYLEWMINKFWGIVFKERIFPNVKRVYDELVKRKSTFKRKINFNDGDDNLWYEPHKDKAVFCHTTQNLNMIYSFYKSMPDYKVEVYRFWDKIDKSDKYMIEKEEEFKREIFKNGYDKAIEESHCLSDYADDFKNNKYPKRFSLDYYRKSGFNHKYGDCRDPGFIIGWDSISNEIRGAHGNFLEVKILIECYFPSILRELFNEEIPAKEGFDTCPIEKRPNAK